MRFIFVFSLLLNSICAASATLDSEIQGLVKFLVTPQLLTTNKQGQKVPKSYYVGNRENVAKYFGDYICLPAQTCEVVDSLYTDPYAILGRGLPPQAGTIHDKEAAQAQLERIDIAYGADIYDASTWQIALALAAHSGYIDSNEASKLIDNQNKRLSHADNRATGEGFQYGYSQAIDKPSYAYVYRMVATNFQNKDPFYQSRYQQFVRWDYDPEEMAANDPGGHDADFFKYVTTWSDWKPITGENAWAQLIGPLQAEYLMNQQQVTIKSPAVKNAINSLYAFSAMQSGVGGIYYAAGGSQGNTGPIEQGEISLENNFSVLGGLQILKQLLKNMPQDEQVIQALKDINVLLHGGKTVNGYQTKGLLSFLYHGAYDVEKGIFYTHGLAPKPSSMSDWRPDGSDKPEAQAVDINTWGIAALGPETIDNWYGKNAALKMWLKVKEKGGYYQDGQFWGVGYTLKNNGENGDNIMSTEWTAGAINAVKMLIEFYKQQGQDVTLLEADLKAMQSAVLKLRNDNYLAAGFAGATPKENYVTVDTETGLAYLYASKRFAIPFGWYANTLSSTTSNAWIIMNKLNFNPFQYQGKLVGESYSIPKEQ